MVILSKQLEAEEEVAPGIAALSARRSLNKIVKRSGWNRSLRRARYFSLQCLLWSYDLTGRVDDAGFDSRQRFTIQGK
jgi:hypothetical protein